MVPLDALHDEVQVDFSARAGSAAWRRTSEPKIQTNSLGVAWLDNGSAPTCGEGQDAARYAGRFNFFSTTIEVAARSWQVRSHVIQPVKRPDQGRSSCEGSGLGVPRSWTARLRVPAKRLPSSSPS